MLRRSLYVLAASIAIALTACDDGTPSPTLPVAPSAVQSPAGNAALEAQVNGLINALYTPSSQGAAFASFARIKAAVASGRTGDAQQSIITFVRDALAAFNTGQLQDPNGNQPPSTVDALRDLLNSVSTFGGLAPPIPPSNPLGGDGAVSVVDPPFKTVVAARGFGGVQFPPGALPADVIVVVERLPNPTVEKQGPLPTTLDQYPLFYDFSTTPPVAQFAQPVTVGICRLEAGEPFGPATQAIADRLVLAHPNPTNPTTVELLEKVAAPFVSCAGVSLARATFPGESRTMLARAVDILRGTGARAVGLFLPTPLYAVHGGLGGLTRSFSPFGTVDPGLKLRAIGLGAHHACVLTTSGAAFCWGLNDQSQLGASTATTCGAVTCSTTPMAVSGAVTFQTLDVGGDFACGLSGTGVRCWGSGANGELGNGSQANSATPVVVAASPLKFVTVGNSHACALTATGSAVCWGSNQQNALGTATGTACGFPCSTTPVAVSGGLTFDSLSAGVQESCGVTAADAGFCWGGIAGLGVLGNGTTAGAAASPVAIAGGLTLRDVQVEGASPCALTTTGQAYCWGNNIAGQVGDGSTTQRLVPVPVAGGLTFASLAAASGQNNVLSHMCAITTAGDAYCWGGNSKGELGAATGSACTFGGPTPCSTVPVLVSGGHSWRALAVGLEFTCGITTSDAVYCWGANTFGQLGNGTTVSSIVPVLVSGSFGGP
jgi:alpha-tubulin suppressor-like RCC1 family protein